MTELPEDIRRVFVVSHDILPEWHIRMQAAFQKHNDSSISKTINFPNSATKEDIAKAYILAWKLKCKGITIYRDGSRETQVLNLKKDMDKKEHAVAVTATNVILPRPRGQSTSGATFKIGTGCGNLYVTVNEDEVGLRAIPSA